MHHILAHNAGSLTFSVVSVALAAIAVATVAWWAFGPGIGRLRRPSYRAIDRHERANGIPPSYDLTSWPWWRR